MDTHKRTLIKTITWRILATILTILAIYIWIGDFNTSLGLGIATNILTTIGYYVHERIWNELNYGRIKP